MTTAFFRVALCNTALRHIIVKVGCSLLVDSSAGKLQRDWLDAR